MKLKISGAWFGDIDRAKKLAEIRFDVSWNGAWKNDTNCDGVWLFTKYRIGDGEWHHINLADDSGKEFDYGNSNPKGFSCGTGQMNPALGMWIPETKKGIFLFPTKGTGDIDAQDVHILWKYGETGIADSDVDKVEIKVFGLEMVYVPKAPYYLGDPDGPDGPANCFYTYYNNGAYYLDSEKPIIVDAVEGHLYCRKSYPPEIGKNSRDDVPFTIPQEFPKGFDAFWCMKYELNTQQYVDFLNTLTRKQQNTHTQADIGTDTIDNIHVMTDTKEEYLRQSIVCPSSGNGTEKPILFNCNAPTRACNVICWADNCAYAAWAGLRPITEMEYEKACRGTADPIPYEFAWGTTRIGIIEGIEGVDGSGNETKLPKTGIVNCWYDGGVGPMHRGKQKKFKHPGFVEGPVRCGIFEATRNPGVSKRENDGATFYGILEMTGNVWSPTVSPCHPKGRLFTGIHGDGSLDENGFADVIGWPDRSGEGAGARGGVWCSPGVVYMAMSRRQAGAHVKAERRFNGGIRLGF